MKTHQTIIEPITTEKSTMLSDKAKYAFKIRPDATKIDVKNAIKAIYDADVVKVNITPIMPKSRYVGRRLVKKRHAGKKAIVTIKDGKTLDISKLKEPKSKKK